MSVRQLSVFLENSPGRVAEVTKILAEAHIDISALVLSDTIDFGVLRLIVSDNDKAYQVLKENSFIVRQSDVIIVPFSREAGSLAKVLEVLGNACIKIEYMYAFLGKESGEAFGVFKMEDLDEAKTVLEKNNIKRICESEL
ncbi:MAG TPA: hypothetical protein GX707_03905 [Epulopiscium sp.]|nr:hypothetical protein [Candidatus Epulonipiscium sp.]